jgi:hypothetical protein
MTSKSIQPFAFRIGQSWVIYNTGDWSEPTESGRQWLTLAIIYVPSTKGHPQRQFRLGWNGRSLERCKELGRLEHFYPGSSAMLQAVLETRVPAPKEIGR